MPEFCDPEESAEYCRQALKEHLYSLDKKFRDEPFKDTFEEVVTAYTMYLASLGYSGTQIHEALAGGICGNVTIDTLDRPGFPFWRNLERFV